ncbi:MAG TPA: lipopolysaccharide heptosyltransferase I [Usitatibacter sp.]|nr:lipopolysaccharide heptosyltransferase I [Usitatibacter sp.]
MSAPHVLFVKLSSLGDVVHHFPAVSDLRGERPEAHISWIVEEAYAALVKLHPAVREVISLNLRQLRGNVLHFSEWRRLRTAQRALRGRHWDFVIDTQGLLKSATVARLARGSAVFGFDRKSARERLAARAYDVGIRVSRELHAVERNRRLVAEVFGYRLQGEACYGLESPAAPPAWAPQRPYVVLLHAASRAAKRWPESHWRELGSWLTERGYAVVFPGGSTEERATAERLAAAIPGAMAAPAIGLDEAAALLAHAAAVAGLDTGLTHLALALGRPTVGIYCATDPQLTGLHGGARAVNVGGVGQTPSVAQVAASLDL